MAIMKSKSENQKLELLITILWNTHLWPFRGKFQVSPTKLSQLSGRQS